MKDQKNHSAGNPLYSNLEKYQSIDLESDWKKVKEKAGFVKRERTLPLWRAAAIAIVILGLGTLSYQYLSSPELLILSTADEQKELLLPDGSQVRLNSYSQLTYPAKFKRKRYVSLQGEGYFEVERDPKRPFRVSINKLANVQVLGTSFNIKAPREGNTVNVQVVEGKVSFSSQTRDGFGTILVMNEQAELRDGEILKKDQPDKNFLSWKTGIIHFDQDRISSVIDILSTYYKREIVLDPAVDPELVFTSTIDNQKLEDVLEEISLVLDLKITYNPDAITISNPN